MNEKNSHSTPEKEQRSTHSRRAVLKLLSASGLALGLEKLLPTSWISPQVSALEKSVPSTGAAFPIEISNLTFNWSHSFITNDQTWCNGSTQFAYFSTAVPITNSIGVFATLNSTGIFSNGGPLFNLSGQVWPSNKSYGNISIPLPGYFPVNQPDGLDIMLQVIEQPETTSNLLSERFIPCNSPLISNLGITACSPKIIKGDLYCTYHIEFDFQDNEGAVSGTSLLTVVHGSEVLVADSQLSALGIFPSDPSSGQISLYVDIPEGNAGKLKVILTNDNGDPSNVLFSASSFVSACSKSLDLFINDSNARLVSNTPTKYEVNFLYNDSAGILSNNSLVTASLANGPLLLNAMPIWNAEGSVQISGNFLTIINGVLNCPPSVFNSTFGSGYFNVVLPEVAKLAVQADENLNWFLGDSGDGRTSNTVTTTLLDPTAVSLEELSAEPQKVGTVAAAAAAALGAATLAAKFIQNDQAAEDTPTGS